jgi:uncharacterized protein
MKGKNLNMQSDTHKAAGPVDNICSRVSTLKSLPFKAVRLKDGFWSERQAVNRKVSLRHGYEMLEKAGNFNNLRIAAGIETGTYSGLNFLDEDVYKWVEALGWELGNEPDEGLQSMADDVIVLITAAQQPDGYLNSYYQTVEPDKKWTDLDFGHELYCAGHLIQAAVAFKRALGDDRLLQVVFKLVEHIDSVFGPGKKEDTCGHPEIEMALVELYRVTYESKYLDLAKFFIDQRGKKKMRGMGSNGPEYHQDHVPFRAAEEVAGHAVRQMYLLTGASDLFMETGEHALKDAIDRLWLNMVGSKMYITGGIGSRYDGESFGEPYEIPPDQCYCETCAAIGSLMWNWRLLLVSGDSRYADIMERGLYNGILSSPSLEGRHFFYVNPLLLRDGKYLRQSTNRPEENTTPGRPEWHSVACCPPNVMRLFSSLSHYLATADADGIQIHHYAGADFDILINEHGRVKFSMETDYPWSGQVKIIMEESDGSPWKLNMRIPGWSQEVSIIINGEPVVSPDKKSGYLSLERIWDAGDVVLLDLGMRPYFIQPHPRIDAIRGCLAVQRGPVVYCIEPNDQEQGPNFLDITLDPTISLENEWRSDLLGGLMTLVAGGMAAEPDLWKEDLYLPLDVSPAREKRKIKITLIPYYAWANRGMTSMRVWIPAAK